MDKDRLNTAKASFRHTVVCLAYPGLCLFEFGIATELFGLKRPELDIPWYDFKVVMTEPSVLSGIGGLRIAGESNLTCLESAGTIVVPGWSAPEAAPTTELREALTAANERGARFMSICSGAFLLGHCGLLDGREATTHWRYASVFHEMFPKASLVPDALYVHSGNVITSAGSAAGIDAGLHIIRNDYGTAVANGVAQRLVMQPHREGGQRQFVTAPVPSRRHELFDDVFEWARQRLDRPISTREMAVAAAMSERNFYRRFQSTIGVTPAVWLLRERIRAARALLEQGEASLESVAAKCGFASVETFRAAFRRELHISPSRYRASFGSRSSGSGGF
ncbi:MAG TPA: transcriptional regulator FtrA [Stenotrophomonas sp.]|nr:transcriptional regulator FtrA [Stenotrophomonas sp.]